MKDHPKASIWQRIRAVSTELAWLKIEAEFGMLTAAEVRGRGSEPSNLLGAHRCGELRYPGWQMSQDAVLPVVAQLRAAAERLDVDQESVLQWMTISTTWWAPEGGRAVDHLDKSDEIIRAFSAHFGVEW